MSSVLNESTNQPANGRTHSHYRLRYDRLDTTGKMTLRRAGACTTSDPDAPTPENAFSLSPTTPHVTVVELDTGEVLSRHLIQPDRSHWRN